MTGILGAARREIRSVLAAPSILAAGLLVPLFWCFILGLTFGVGLMRELPVAWVDMDHSEMSREAQRRIDAAPSIALTAYATPLSAEAAMRSGDVYAVLTIPTDWEKDLRSGTGGTIIAEMNRAYYPVTTFLEVDLKTALADFAASAGAQKRAAAVGGGSLDANARFLRAMMPEAYFLGNTAFNFAAYLTAPVLPGVLALGAVLAFACSLVREWRDGGVRELLCAAGGSRLKAVIGKLLPWFLLYVLAHAVWVAAFSVLSGWMPAGNILFWFTAGCLLMLAMVGLALLVTSTSLTWVLAISCLSVLCAPAFPFTGFSYPLESMTPAAAFWAELLPLTHYLRAQSEVWALGSGLTQILRTQGVLFVYALFTFTTGMLLWSWRLAHWAEKESALEHAHPVSLPTGVVPTNTGFFGVAASFVRQIVLNRDAALVFAGAVAFYLVYYGWPYKNEQLENIPTAVVDLDRSAASRSLIRALDAAPAVDVVLMTPDAGSAGDLMRRRGADVVVTIPEDFAENLALGANMSIPVVGNGAYPVKTRAVQAALSGVLPSDDVKTAHAALTELGTNPTTTWTSAPAAPSLIVLNRGNTISGYATYIVPLVAPLIVQAVITVGAALTFGQWLRRRDPIVREAARRPGFAGLALWCALFVYALLWNLYAQGADFYWWEFNGFANPTGTVAVLVLYAGAVASFAMGFTALWGRAETAAPAAIVMSAPLFFASGAVWPAELITNPIVQAAAIFFPSSAAIPALMRVSQAGSDFSTAVPYAFQMIFQTLFWGAAAVWALRRTNDT